MGGNYYVTKTDIYDSSIPPLADNDYSHEPFGDVQGDSLIKLFKQFKVEGNFSKSRFQSVYFF
jgi:hypothetical protein